MVDGFTNQFKWNWLWRAKDMGNGTFQIRFPNKNRLEEISNFEEFTLKGTNVRIKVRAWIQEAMAAGRMHEVWVVVSGLPDSMKGCLALCEVGSNLGVVLEVDMESVRSKDVIRIKVGMMNTFVLPLSLVLSTPKLLLYEVSFSLEEVVKVGWVQNADRGKRPLEYDENKKDDSADKNNTKRRNVGMVVNLKDLHVKNAKTLPVIPEGGIVLRKLLTLIMIKKG
ncbi:hypothetical protein GUJ93_ZPchr0012g20293 [Zizania palustris]|uniref:DUF4283 domain-containing protein n=1 Tax=Zizania palustris TaxID=103762 RepID=A0A8J5WLT4_ZIZPA|nr:hypothetical protein GUJ93_ZPchr0012g20293 [Zizania palustris]